MFRRSQSWLDDDSFETGFTRYFTVRYVDSSALQVVQLDTTDRASGTVLLCLSASTAEIDGAIRWAQGEQFVQGSIRGWCVNAYAAPCRNSQRNSLFELGT
jgi:hypothetical protein